MGFMREEGLHEVSKGNWRSEDRRQGTLGRVGDLGEGVTARGAVGQ